MIISTLHSGFSIDATIGQVNTLLTNIDAEIIGVWPGNPERQPPRGLDLTLRVPTHSCEAVLALTHYLHGNLIVIYAVPVLFGSVIGLPPPP
jgi:hypothetical protein